MKAVSIVIPTYNGRPLLEKNLPTVLAAMREGDELIIVDDASTDQTLAWLQEAYQVKSEESNIAGTIGYGAEGNGKKIKVLINQSNQRFASSCNRGAKTATKDILILLNNDVSPTPEFIEPLTIHFQEPLVFAVGCKELATNESDKEYGRSEARYQRGFFVHKRAEDQSKTETAWVVGGSGAFRRTMWELLGGFDVSFKPAYGEDIDLSLRAKKRGWQVLFEPKSIVYHNHESTNVSVFSKYQIDVMSFKNAFLIMWRDAPMLEKIKHIFWLPYHLVFTTLRSRGAFLYGFFQALVTQLGLT